MAQFLATAFSRLTPSLLYEMPLEMAVIIGRSAVHKKRRRIMNMFQHQELWEPLNGETGQFPSLDTIQGFSNGYGPLYVHPKC